MAHRGTRQDAVAFLTLRHAELAATQELKGLIEQGLAADVAVLDPETINDRGTYADGRLSPVGIEYVVVNGRLVVEQGQRNSVFPGRVLKPLA